MWTPPPYPRIPHLFRRAGTTRDDRVLSAGEAANLLHEELVIEEKLDGSNVMIWKEGERIQVAGRAGTGAMDRAGQLGPLRSWAAAHEGALEVALRAADVLYAEWMWLAHSSVYDRLPAFLIVIDLWRRDGGFSSPNERDTSCAGAGLATPPILFRGRPHTSEFLNPLFGKSAFGESPAEGIVLRGDHGARAKLLAPSFRRIEDDSWRSPRPRNQLQKS